MMYTFVFEIFVRTFEFIERVKIRFVKMSHPPRSKYLALPTGRTSRESKEE